MTTTTKLAIIRQAFGEIGLRGYVFNLTPDEMQDCFDKLQNLAAEWDGMGARVGYSFAGNTDAESGLPDTAVDCFAKNLAVRLAPSYGKTISPDLRTAAAVGFNALLVALRRRPEVPYPGLRACRMRFCSMYSLEMRGMSTPVLQ